MKLSGLKRARDRRVALWAQTALVLSLGVFVSAHALAQAVPMMAVPPMPEKTTPSPNLSAPTGSVQPPIASVAAAIAPVAGATAPSTATPSPAEMAIVRNAASLKAPQAKPENPSVKTAHVAAERAKNRVATDKGLRVTDILATPAQIRPLPTRYLVVKRDHSSDDYESLLVAARLALSNGHYAAALGLFNELFRRNPDDQRVLMGRAVALQDLGQGEEAIDTYRRVLQIDPDNVSAMTNVLGLIKGEDTASAIGALQKLREMYPANVAVTAQLGMLYGVAGDYSNAIKYLNMADALKPGDSVILYNRAVAYDHLGKTDKAAELYHRILNLASEGKLGTSLPLDDIRQRLATLR